MVVGLLPCKLEKSPKVIKPKNSSSLAQETRLSWFGIFKRRAIQTPIRNGASPERLWRVSSLSKANKLILGHSHFISDLSLSQDSRYCLTGSWDGTLRLWDLRKGQTIKRFVSHTRDVLACAFSPDNRQIASGGRDKNVKIWNTVGECKFTVEQNAHTDWVSCVKFYQDNKTPIVVSASWDKTIKVWDNQTMTLKHTFVGHKA